MLGGARVLIVEDEAWVAIDLADAVEDANGEVVGPFATVRAALAALETEQVAAAILDVNLTDRDITPVAALLVERQVPVLIHTGRGVPETLRRIHPNLPVLKKPASKIEVIETLARLIPMARAPGQLPH
jgi:DNA-binding response OmpR family regulator